jgi:guanylate kinase
MARAKPSQDDKTAPAPGARAPGRLIVITGPSGVGKSTIVRRVLRKTGAAYSVSVTTRPPRAGEREGVDYRFVDRAAFEKMVRQRQLLEHAEVFGQAYGTPAEPVRRAIGQGRSIILEIDVQGGLQVRRRMPQATFILILPPGEEELKRRLRGRGTEAAAAVRRRLAQARREIETARRSGAYTFTVVNDNLDGAVRRVVEILRQESS